MIVSFFNFKFHFPIPIFKKLLSILKLWNITENETKLKPLKPQTSKIYPELLLIAISLPQKFFHIFSSTFNIPLTRRF
jgi:hypothetical protein